MGVSGISFTDEGRTVCGTNVAPTAMALGPWWRMRLAMGDINGSWWSLGAALPLPGMDLRPHRLLPA